MSDVISLHSSEGQRLFTETCQNALYYQPILYNVFHKQVNSTYCGLVSSVLTMNANFIGKHSTTDAAGPQVPFTEANMFSFKETQSILNQSEVVEGGCTLDQIANLVKAHSYDSSLYYASDSSMEEFRTKAKSALSNINSSTSVIINYDLMAIYPNQEVKGHFSPLCAYHEASDRFLILDTWPKTEECWVTSEHLFNSMNTIDASVSKSRGYIIVAK